MPAKRNHMCCPNAQEKLVGYACKDRDHFNWQLRLPHKRSVIGQNVPVIYCPWCGADLEEARKIADRPRLVGG